MTDVVREALEAAVDFIQREADLRDASAFAETDPYIAEPRALCIKLAAALSALGEKDDGWLPIESAPTLDRVIVAGWQPRNRNIIGYWWYHEDVTDEHGKPMVRHSLREREYLLSNAASLVQPLEFLMPAWRWWERPFYFSGLRLYDWLAGLHSMGSTRLLTRNETLSAVPELQASGLRGAVVYHDAQFDDARLAVALAQTAANYGVVVFNYLPVFRLLHRGNAVCGAVVREMDTGQELEVKARRVVNCTEVFSESILAMDQSASELPVTIAPSRGSHLVVDSSFLAGQTALIIPRTDDGRVLFVIPWLGKVVLDDSAVDRANGSNLRPSGFAPFVSPCPIAAESLGRG